LLKAIGATPSQVLLIFLVEALMLSVTGGAVGVAGGFGIATVIGLLFPGLPFSTPIAYVLAALITSLVVGLASGVLPALRATRLDPVDALRAE